MADFLSQSSVIWFLIGLVLILLELVVPGLVLVFFGVGAWVTALVCLFLEPSLNTQLFIFLISSVTSLALLRRAIKRKYMDIGSPEGELEDEYIGQTAVAITGFGAGTLGKVLFKGANWEAISDQPVTEGQQLKITGYKSIRLTVEPLN
ncbi:MAG: NfeD family protein [Chitinophagales bacterium]|nr:NfeD family protein [Chitinophagaceae bacterium]MCB9063800.1 NfeD family protein [Chitinophagales bacterium]